MARQAAQAKMGFYPIPPPVIDMILPHLVMPPTTAEANKVTILDPCAGEGKALKQIAEGLGVKEDRVYAVELDVHRGRAVAEALPSANVLHPCSYRGTQITKTSFSLIYMNPPFGDELGGGGREEEGFLEESIPLLVPGGLLVFVAPQPVFENYRVKQKLGEVFENDWLYKFPDEHRKFRECVYIGVKRSVELSSYQARGKSYLNFVFDSYDYSQRGKIKPLAPGHLRLFKVGGDGVTEEENLRKLWNVPTAWKPHTFKKVKLTQDELVDVVIRSPLVRLLDPPPPALKPSPPLPLSNGQVALLVMSGQIDGVVHPPGEEPHVVRGSCRKVDYLAEVTVNETESATITKTKHSQMVVPVLRAVGRDGVIYDMEATAKNEKDTEHEGELDGD